MSATIGKVYVDAVITDERYRECMALVQEANKRIDELRELVRDWREFAIGGADSLTDWNHQQAELEHRMRELGIEVDG